NLPMLIEMVSAQLVGGAYNILALMEQAAEAGKNGTQLFHASTMGDDEDDDL
ncbi:MAG: PTS mannose transporter subunit IID, partial [Selenomonas sp.]|nr:PTS mannose transporter subunit IID [Selenomonas sp.]